MVTEPHAPPDPSRTATASPIENEIPSYRAINPLAVLSIVLAVLSILSFANSWFLLASLFGVILGALGIRQISSQPDVWTGSTLAKSGIALSLAFGISAFTVSSVQIFLIRQKAAHFAQTYLVKALNNPDINYALWYRLTPPERKFTKPLDTKDRFTDASRGPESFRMSAGQVYGLHLLLERDPKARVEFLRVEQAGYDGINPTALVLLKVHHAPDIEKKSQEQELQHQESKDLPPIEPLMTVGDYAAVVLLADSLTSSDAWWVSQYIYPYEPDSYVQAAEPVDDGHGHAH